MYKSLRNILGKFSVFAIISHEVLRKCHEKFCRLFYSCFATCLGAGWYSLRNHATKPSPIGFGQDQHGSSILLFDRPSLKLRKRKKKTKLSEFKNHKLQDKNRQDMNRMVSDKIKGQERNRMVSDRYKGQDRNRMESDRYKGQDRNRMESDKNKGQDRNSMESDRNEGQDTNRMESDRYKG